MQKPLFICLAALCLLSLFVIETTSLVHKEITYDENAHYEYGRKMLKGNPTRIEFVECVTMPFSALNVLLPGLFGYKTVESGRIVNILFSLLLGFFVLKWARELYGDYAGLAALFFYCFDPNIIAFSQLVMADSYAALMMLLSCYFFWRFMREGGIKNGLISAAVLGTAQLAKYTCMTICPLLLFYAVALNLPPLFQCIRSGNFKALVLKLRNFFAYFLLFVSVGLFLVNAGFLFYKSGMPLAQYEFQTNSFKKLQTLPIANMPLPLPEPYLIGLDRFKNIEQNGYMWDIYLFGEHRKAGPGQGFKGYFFWVLLFKTPIALQIIFFAALIRYFVTRGYRQFVQNEAVIFLPIVFFLVYYNYFIYAQFGIRSILFILPLAWVFCGSLFADWKGYSFRVKAVLGALLVYLAISVLSYYPHFVPYFNEIVWDRKTAYKYLADSNIEIGGEGWYVTQYLKEHPGIPINPSQPMVGKAFITINEYVGVVYPEKYRWARENFKPIGHVAHMFLLFDFTREDLYKAYLKYNH
jgi:4-amino-4-deoxy-L-arabinose transferase-like glycosyltransferase